MKLIGGYAALIIYLWVTTWRPWIVLAAVCTAVLATVSSSALGQSQLLHLGVSGLAWPPSVQPRPGHHIQLSSRPVSTVTSWRFWIVMAALCTAVLATISTSSLGQFQPKKNLASLDFPDAACSAILVSISSLAQGQSQLLQPGVLAAICIAALATSSSSAFRSTSNDLAAQNCPG
jgi:hypothetical protein